MAEEGTNEELELDPSLIAEEGTPQEEPKQETKAEEQEDEIPEKYRGKTAMEIIRMHQDAERLIGRQGNEVGELRRIVDDIVAKTSNAEPSKAPEPEPDFFEDPEGATSRTAKKIYESDPELQEVKQTVKQMKQREAAQELLRRHPDAAELSNDPNFGAWVQKSNLRTKLFMQAHENFDHEAASELFDMYKESKAFNQQTERAATEERAKQVKRAATGSGKASGETRGKPILSREAIVNLRVTDPEKYQRLLPTLRQAYQEGRVK